LTESSATNILDGTSTHKMKGLPPYLQRNIGKKGKVLQFGTKAPMGRMVVLEKSVEA
jgi:hypothetical protein